MTNATTRIATAAAFFLALPALASAQITSIGEFTGDHYSDLAGVPLEPLKGRLTPAGYLTTRNLHGLNGAVAAGVAPHQTTSARGGRLLRTGANTCTMPEDLRWRPIGTAVDIGMYLGSTSQAAETVTFFFEDSQGNVIDSVDTLLAPGGEWTWVGFHSAVPVGMIVIHNPRAGADVSVLVDALTTSEPSGGSTIGTEFGDATLNSTGFASSLSAEGSASIAAADLTLRATDVPSLAFGQFLFSPTKGHQVLGDGILCLGTGQLQRLAMTQATGGGVLEHALDLGTMPVTAGTTWYFQTVFRDPAAGGTGFNLSQGLSITFE